MWHPFRRRRIEPVIVPPSRPAELPNPEIQQQTEVASLRALAARHQVQALADSIHERLAGQALAELRGRQ